jgi:hypothetical protein
MPHRLKSTLMCIAGLASARPAESWHPAPRYWRPWRCSLGIISCPADDQGWRCWVRSGERRPSAGPAGLALRHVRSRLALRGCPETPRRYRRSRLPHGQTPDLGVQRACAHRSRQAVPAIPGMDARRRPDVPGLWKARPRPDPRRAAQTRTLQRSGWPTRPSTTAGGRIIRRERLLTVRLQQPLHHSEAVGSDLRDRDVEFR